MYEILGLPPNGPSLAEFPQVAPHPVWRRIVEHAMKVARHFSRRIPDRLTVLYVEAPERHFGETREFPDGRVEVIFNCTMPLGEWPRVALHELQHVDDAGRGLPQAERESRAIEFSENVLRWHVPPSAWR